MTDAIGWDSLRLLRSHGQRPSLPVIVTSHRWLPNRLWGVGCLVVYHPPGTPFPVRLLDGLDVILMLERCELAEFVQRLADTRGVQFARLRTWCACERALNVSTCDCKDFKPVNDWLEGVHAA